MKKILTSIFLSLVCIAASAQIKGKVTDKATQEPMIGVVVINNTNGQSDVTLPSGEFSLKGGAGDVLTFSMMGYEELQATVPAGGFVAVQMSPESQFLQETVVVGYATQKKINVTGAVSSISGDVLNNRPVTSAMNALQGVDPSVNIKMQTGDPMSSHDINIRGVPSINGGSPLVLVDGVPGIALNQVNANDIESISVLKDASASAIYGAKASAGVILVTTKQGKGGEAKISYSNNFGWTSSTTPHDYITSGYDYVSIINPLYYSRYGYDAFLYNSEDLHELELRRNDVVENPERPWVVVGDDGKYRYYGNFDWYHALYNTQRFHQEHNLSASGGNKEFRYYISGRAYSQEGQFSGNMVPVPENYSNYALRGKFDFQLKKWARWSSNISYNHRDQIYPGWLNKADMIAVFDQNVCPMFVPYNPDGTIVMYPQHLRNLDIGSGRISAIADKRTYHKILTNNITSSNNLHLDIVKGLTFDITHNMNYYKRLYIDRENAIKFSREIGVVETNTSRMKDSYRERPYESYLHSVDAFASYRNTFADAHHFSAVAGMNYETYRLVDNTIKSYNLGSDQLSSFNSTSADTYYEVTQEISAYKTLGFFSRVNYDYKGRYLAEASFRADGTSRFAENSRWGFFPSASLGWLFTEEPFMENAKSWFDMGKVRLSYGALGNQQVSNYLYQDRITTGTLSYLFDDEKAKYTDVTKPVSSGLTWETVISYNAGLDLSFFKNRLNFNGDVFIRDTKNMLTQSLTLPAAFGADTPKENCADLRTRGWEMQVSWKDTFKLAGKPFYYNLKASVGDYRTFITRYNNPEKLFSNYYVGKELGEIWGYHVEGLFATDEEAAAYQAAINNSNNVYQRVYNMVNDGYLRAGDVKFLDADGSGSIGIGSGTVDKPGDMRIIGNSTPRYNYSFGLDLNYYGFDFGIFFQGVGKMDWYPTANKDAIQGANAFWQLYSYPIGSFISKNFMDNVWTEENPDAYFPRLRPIQCYNGGPLAENNDRYLQNAAYLRLKNISLGYTLPDLTKFITKCRVYVSAENVCYFSAMKKYCPNIDPELAVASNTVKAGTGQGYEMPRTLSFGLDLTF